MTPRGADISPTATTTTKLGGQAGADELGGLLVYLWCGATDDTTRPIALPRSFGFEHDG